MVSNNPFRPSFGIPPAVLAGREDEVGDFTYGLLAGIGSLQRSVLISGPRGVGKTVLLNAFEEQAKANGWVVVRADADDELEQNLTHTALPEALEELDYKESESGRRISGISVAGIGSISTEHRPSAVVPTLKTRLRKLVRAVSERGTGVLITIDEMQAAPIKQVATLATAIQDVLRDEMDIAFAAAGLTKGIEELLEHDGTTFMRRADRIELGPISDEAVAEVLTTTIRNNGKDIADDALKSAVSLIQGYPFLVQLVGAMVWLESERANTDLITEELIDKVEPTVVSQMGRQIHSVALKHVPPREMEYLFAMAEISAESGEKAVATGQVAKHLGAAANSLSMARRSLIERDLIQAPSFGLVEFRLPHLREYLLR